MNRVMKFVCFLALLIAIIGMKQESKFRLMDSISRYRKNMGKDFEILYSAQTLEESVTLKPNIKSIDGTWSLIYSTMSTKLPENDNSDVFSLVMDNLYQEICRIAPFLAGSQEIDYNPNFIITSIQQIDSINGIIRNSVVLFYKPFNFEFKIYVNGNARPLNDNNDLEVTFTSLILEGFKFPLPNPKGLLLTTYCDSNLRISRGSKGGLFILKRIR